MRTGQRQMMQPPMQAAQVNVQAPAPQHGYPQNQMLQNAHPSAVGTHAIRTIRHGPHETSCKPIHQRLGVNEAGRKKRHIKKARRDISLFYW